MDRARIVEIAEEVCSGSVDPDQLRSALVELSAQGESAEDILAFVRPFQKASVPLHTKHETVLDMCGTGGASFRTFNVSTLASIVVSTLGVPVAKHGNRSSNGMCGSADMLEALGVNIDMTPEQAGKALDEIGLTFIFAPRYNPAMRHAVPVRREIGKKTIFNVLGPLLNPVAAKKRHLMGVYDSRLLDVLPSVLMTMGVDRAVVVYGQPGMDEVSLLGRTQIAEVNNGIIKYEIYPRELGLQVPGPADIAEQSPSRSAETARRILAGEEGPRSEMVALNAAVGLYVFGAAKDIATGLDMSRKALSSGRAMDQLDRLRMMSGR